MSRCKKYGYSVFKELDSNQIEDRARQKITLVSPNCSAVLENNAFETNQLGWLERFGESNDKAFDSSVFEERQQAKIHYLRPEMKFSFHPNDSEFQKNNIELERERENIRLNQPFFAVDSQISEEEIKSDFKRKGGKIGSIRKNTSMSNYANESTLQNASNQTTNFQKLTLLSQRLDEALFQRRVQSNSMQHSEPKVLVNILPIAPLKAKKKQFLQLEVEETERESSRKPQIEDKLYLLFAKLDANNLGYLSKGNCKLEGLQQELKLVFGPILGRIRLRGQQISLKDFVEVCKGIVAEFEWKDIYSLFDFNNSTESQFPSFSMIQIKTPKFETNFSTENVAKRKSKSTFNRQQINYPTEQRTKNRNQKRAMNKNSSFRHTLSRTPYVSEIEESLTNEIMRDNYLKVVPRETTEDSILEQKQSLLQIERLNSRLQIYLKRKLMDKAGRNVQLNFKELSKLI